LLERVSWFVHDETNGRGSVNLYFENRSNLSYQRLTDYIEHIKPDQSNQVFAKVLGIPIPRTKDQLKNLQIADVYAEISFAALEPNRFGMNDSGYLNYVRNRLYRRGGNLLSYGFKLLPHDKGGVFLRQYEWLDEL